MKDINEIMLHPVRMRIIQDLAVREAATVTELCARISDVPRTTIYRHIRLLIEHQIIQVLSEKKIRGSLERTLALNVPALTSRNTAAEGAKNAFGFLMTLYGRFHRYYLEPGADPGQDRIFMVNRVLMMDDPEFEAFMREFGDLLARYDNAPQAGRRMRDLSIVSAPVKEQGEDT